MSKLEEHRCNPTLKVFKYCKAQTSLNLQELNAKCAPRCRERDASSQSAFSKISCQAAGNRHPQDGCGGWGMEAPGGGDPVDGVEQDARQHAALVLELEVELPADQQPQLGEVVPACEA